MYTLSVFVFICGGVCAYVSVSVHMHIIHVGVCMVVGVYVCERVCSCMCVRACMCLHDCRFSRLAITLMMIVGISFCEESS